jgi:hypothetical protein
MRKVPVPVTGASYSPFFYRLFVDLFFVFGDLGFFVFQLFLQLSISGSAIFIADAANPAMSSEALGGLPRAQATRQGSRASGRPGQRKEKRSKGKEKAIAKLLHYCQILNRGRNRGMAGHTPPAMTTFQKKGGD